MTDVKLPHGHHHKVLTALEKVRHAHTALEASHKAHAEAIAKARAEHLAQLVQNAEETP